MNPWYMLLVLAGIGLLGGMLNSLIKDKGFIMPHTKQLDDGSSLWQPGFIGNMITGAFAAAVVSGLSGPLSQLSSGSSTKYEFTATIIISALVAGFGGAKILSDFFDNKQKDKVTQSQDNLIDSLVNHITSSAPIIRVKYSFFQNNQKKEKTK